MAKKKFEHRFSSVYQIEKAKHYLFTKVVAKTGEYKSDIINRCIDDYIEQHKHLLDQA